MFKKGFTILELLIVIAVIAILVGIALPRFKGMRDEGNYARAKGELRTLQTGVESYYIHSGSYPASDTLSVLTTASPTIISALPTDPFTSGSNYGYKKSANGNYYVIYSVGVGGTATITGISDAGALSGSAGDDIYVSNGAVQAGG